MSVTSIVIPAGHGKAVRLRAQQCVQVVNTHGTQVVDCWAWSAYDLDEYMCMEATRVYNQHLNPLLGDSFVTNERRPILTVVEDTSPGVHDTFMAACDRRRYELLGCTHYHRNCADNMFEGMLELGATPSRRNLASFNIFMNIRVQADNIQLDTLPTVTRPGDYITLRAEMDCFVAFSACPQDIVSIQGQGDNTPKDAELRIIDEPFAHIPVRGPWVPEHLQQR
ncbi:urea carboxylase-associated family protein [Pseudomonas sp. Z8(2022)]|uniref:urea carboxylase-associated family protein n=1 Tax=Pseudomonas sp. Z8(2022) TaxID=2962597 RepID=UPI0021F3E5FE|nr:urea carboxylase-associated family protein [Pseudomonas sp. Z8(2022)]UYP29523.1 urea carboxylase-associated family protein [Pseudomonas sp. Z8(2022)]